MTVKRSAALGFIFVTILVDVIGLGIIIPILPPLIEQLTGKGIAESAWYGGWLVFAFAFMQFICAPIMGALSDRFGRRPILLLSLFGLGIDYLFHAMAPSIGWLFLGRIIAGFFGASFSTATAYIADISEPEKRAQNFGLVGAAFGLGFIIGPVLGGVLSQWGLRIPFYAAAILSLTNMIYGYFILPESLPVANRRPFEWLRANPVGSLMHLRKYPIISGLIVSIALVYLASQAVQTTWTYYTMEKFQWDSKYVGLSLGFVGIMIVIVQGGLIRYTIPKLGAKKSVILGLILYTIGLLLFAFATKSWMMFAFVIPYCLGGISGPALQGIMSNQVGNNEQGELQGALTSLMGLSSVIGPPIMTGLFYYFSNSTGQIKFPGAPFFAGAIMIIASVLFSLRSLTEFHVGLSTENNSIEPKFHK